MNRSDLLKVNLIQDKLSIAYSGVLDESDQIDAKIMRFFDRATTGEFGFANLPPIAAATDQPIGLMYLTGEKKVLGK